MSAHDAVVKTITQLVRVEAEDGTVLKIRTIDAVGSKIRFVVEK